MAATYVNNLVIAEPADGDTNWGATTNTSLELIGEALGIGTEAKSINFTFIIIFNCYWDIVI